MSTTPSVTTPVPVPAAEKPSTPRKRRRAFLIFFAVLLILGTVAFLYWLHARDFETTDDAQVDAHLNPISARVDGTITNVYVDDNQFVKVGDPLVNLDPRDSTVALDQAKAALLQAQSQLIAQEPNIPITQVENVTNISTGEADVANAKAALLAAQRDRQAANSKLAESQANDARAQADLARYTILIAKEEVSQQEFDQIAATAKAQTATVEGNRASLAGSDAIVTQREAQLQQAQSRLVQYQRNAPRQIAIRSATVKSEQANATNAQAQVEAAQLKLSYSKVTAPVAGIVMSRSAEVGAHITAGQQLMQIAQVNDIWVTANFKETQLERVKPQQSVTIHVDAVKRDYQGYVESIGGSTGAVASVLPPENATGNFVKVVQRIPVRIRFKADQSGLDRLRPGMSVEPEVRIGS